MNTLCTTISPKVKELCREENGPDGLPGTHNLSSAYPNPFNPQANFTLEVAEQQSVRIVVYDALGRQVRVLLDGTRQAGAHEVVFDTSDLPSGTYLYRLETPQGSYVRTMLLVK